MLLINCEINIFSRDSQEPKFPPVTLSDQDNAKLLQQLKTGFKRMTNWNKHKSEPTLQTRNCYLNYLIDPIFQRVNRLFVLSFENDAYRRSYRQFFLPTVEIKDYNVIIDEKKLFLSQPVKNHLITYKNIRKIDLVKEMITQLVVC